MAIHKDLTGETAIHQASYVTSSDPGAVGANKLWIDTSAGPPYQLKRRNAGNSAWENVGTSTSESRHVIQDEGSLRPARANLNFVGSGVSVTDDAVNNQTDVAIAGPSGTTLDSLSDAAISSPALRQGLFYDGTNFVNQYDPGHFVAPENVSANTSADAAKRTYFVDASGGTRTITLPSAIGRAGKEYVVKKIDTSANVVAVDTTTSQTIDGASPPWNIRFYNESLTFVSDGANWQITAESIDLPLDDVRDVNTSGAVADDLLQFDGTNWVPVDPASVGAIGGGGGGFTPAWVQSGPGSKYAAWGDGDAAKWGFLGGESGIVTNITPSVLGITAARCVRFRLPKALSVAHLWAFCGASTTGVFTLAIYPASSGSSRVWQSGALNTTANTWLDVTANMPFSLSANTDYWLALAATTTSGSAAFSGLYQVVGAYFGADAGPLGGLSIGVPVIAQFAVPSGSWPATLPALAAVPNSSPMVVTILEGIAS